MRYVRGIHSLCATLEHVILRGSQSTEKSRLPPNPVSSSALLQCSKDLYELEKCLHTCNNDYSYVLTYCVSMDKSRYYGLQFIWLNKNIMIALAHKPLHLLISDGSCMAI